MIRRVDDPAALQHEGAAELTRIATAAIDRDRSCSIALAGGSTPRGLYRLLADRSAPYRDRLAWDRIHLFWGDERHVPPDHPDSNYRMVREAMLSDLPLPPGNVHRVRGEAANAETAAAEYEEELRRFFRSAPGGWPRFDLILLGLGVDGHTASIFPGSPAVTETRRRVTAVHLPPSGPDRITFTPPLINRAAHVVFLVAGAAKAETLKEALEGDAAPERLPARAIRPADGALLWLVDREAAADLAERGSDGGAGAP